MVDGDETDKEPLVDKRVEPTQAVASWRALFNFTERSHLIVLLPALFLSAISGILLPALAIFFGKFFDALSSFGAGAISDRELVQKVLANTYALVTLGGATWLMKGGYFTIWLVFGELQAKSVRDTLFQELLKKDLEWFEARSSGVGSLLSRLQTQIRELQMGTSQPLGFCVNYTVQAVASLGVCFYYSWRITLVTLAGVPLSVLGLSFIGSKLQPSIISQERELAKASGLAINALTSVETVKCFNGQAFEIRQYTISVRKAADFYVKQALNNGLQIGFVRCITTSMFVQGFWYGSYLVRRGDSTTGAVVTTFWSCLMATKAWEDILPHINVLAKGQAAGVALKAILVKVEKGRKLMQTSTSTTPKFCEGDIEVSFAYPLRPDHFVLHPSTFFFPAGETTFVVGTSGSGKSTLGNLLMRFYTPSAGGIFIDGRSIQDLDPDWLRNNITLVQQSSILFNETILRNIAFGRSNFRSVNIGLIKVCIELAALQSTISQMPKGLETMVGSGGSALSGGQKQRIAIARARLRDTPILVLDESTSALDYTSRTSVIDAIRAWRRGKTTIIITHDMAQIRKGDFVYVLQDGHIAEEGYRHSLGSGNEHGLFSKRTESPKIPATAHFNSAFSPRRTLRKLQDSTVGRGSVNSSTSSIAERDSIDIQLDSFAQDFAHNPQSLSFRLAKTPRSEITRPSTRIQAFSNATKRQGIRGTLLLQNPAVQQDLRSLRSPTARIGAGASRPISVHQAIVMRSMYLSPTVGRRLGRGSAARGEALSPPHALIHVTATKSEKQQIVSIKDVLQTLWPSLNVKDRSLLLLGFVSVLVHAAGIPAFSYIFAQLLGTFFLKHDQAQEALIYSMAILGISVLDAVACFLSWYLLEAVGESWVDTVRLEAMTCVLDQPKAWFEAEENSVSKITSCLDRNAEEMRNLVGRFAGIVITVAAMMLIAIIWALITCWKLTLVGLTAAPLLYCITKSYEAVSSRWEARTNVASDITETIFVEAFSDVRTVRALTLERYFHKKYTRATSNALSVGIQRAAYSGFFFGASDSAINFVTALIFWYGGEVVRSYEFPVKPILTVFAMLLFSTANATSVIAFIPQISSSVDTASRLLRLARLPVRSSHEHVGKLRLNSDDPKTLSGPIKFANLTFSYPSRPEVQVLSNLNLTIPHGQCTAIVGTSGSGKSTIASLLLGLYPPSTKPKPETASTSLVDPPSLTISGHDIRTLHLPTLRGMISIVLQTPTLFSTSVRTNITYGLTLDSPLVSQANVEHAARGAGIHDFIVSLPQGYETVIGDGGLGVSGGQAQRIVIARAMCRRPKILILDEATSALDGESALVVRQSVLELLKTVVGLTVIIITHAKDMMQCADKVVVLERGTVAEEGGFRELVARKGKLWEMLKVGGLVADSNQ